MFDGGFVVEAKMVPNHLNVQQNFVGKEVAADLTKEEIFAITRSLDVEDAAGMFETRIDFRNLKPKPAKLGLC